MRRIDKKFNLTKANLLAENRYLENKDSSENNNILSSILSNHDGPVDDYVAIYRAVVMASNGGDAETIANALHQALEELKSGGEIPSSEPNSY